MRFAPHLRPSTSSCPSGQNDLPLSTSYPSSTRMPRLGRVLPATWSPVPLHRGQAMRVTDMDNLNVRRLIFFAAWCSLATSCASPPPPTAGLIYVRGRLHLGQRPEIRPFFLDRTEVTVAQYQECVVHGQCTPASKNDGDGGWSYCNALRQGAETHPINCVTASQAEHFCAWRGSRLPTSEEWKWASTNRWRHTPYPWGRRRPSAQTACYGQRAELGNADRSKFTETSCPVGTHDFSRDGIADLGGNMAEWVLVDTSTLSPLPHSARDYTYHYTPMGPAWTSPGISPWGERQEHLGSRIDEAASTVGFRCARDLPPAPVEP